MRLGFITTIAGAGIAGAGLFSFPAAGLPSLHQELRHVIADMEFAGFAPVRPNGVLQLARSDGNQGGGQGQGQGQGQGNSGEAQGSGTPGNEASGDGGGTSSNAGGEASDATDDDSSNASDGNQGNAGSNSGEGDQASSDDPGGGAETGNSNPNDQASGNEGGQSTPSPSSPPAEAVVPDPETVGSIATSGSGASSLPAALSPSSGGASTFVTPGSTEGIRIEPARQALSFVPGTPVEIVWICREALIAAARPHGVVQVDASSVGALQQDTNGNFGAPLEVRIIYAREGGTEIRQARMNCRLDSRRTVIGLQ